jgi:hypothetical protein
MSSRSGLGLLFALLALLQLVGTQGQPDRFGLGDLAQLSQLFTGAKGSSPTPPALVLPAGRRSPLRRPERSPWPAGTSAAQRHAWPVLAQLRLPVLTQRCLKQAPILKTYSYFWGHLRS